MKEFNDSGRRLDWGHFVDRAFWGILTAAAIFVSSQINKMSSSIDELNKTMAVVLYQNSESHDRLNKIDARMDLIESRLQKH